MKTVYQNYKKMYMSENLNFNRADVIKVSNFISFFLDHFIVITCWWHKVVGLVVTPLIHFVFNLHFQFPTMGFKDTDTKPCCIQLLP